MADVQIVDLTNAEQKHAAEVLEVLTGSVCAFGVFDGLHKGHQVIFSKTFELAAELNVPSVVLTFDIDPDDIFNPAQMKLMSNEHRLEQLANVGFYHVLAFHFDRDFASMSADEFLNRAFANNVPRALIVGNDLRFGHLGQGDVNTLRAWGQAHGMEVIEVPLFEEDGSPVKSTRIRALIEEGNIQEAEELLGHPLDLDQYSSGS